MYPKKCLSTLYNSCPGTIICYGLIICGTAHKTNLESNDRAQRGIIRTIVSKSKFDRLGDVYKQTKTLTIYEMCIREIFCEIINQLRSKSPLDFRHEMENRNRYNIRRCEKNTNHGVL